MKAREPRVSVALETLGCRVNQSESSAVEGTLRRHGISVVSLEENPDYCIINTCTVTGKSDANSRQIIRKASRAGAKVIVTGCYSELRRDDVSAMDGVYEVVPSSQKDRIVALILGREAEMRYDDHNKARPYLKVQDGCDFSCSYCAVPLARGRSRSLPIETAVERAQSIQSQGYQEVVLTGIHLGSYGRDLTKRSSLAELIRNILIRTTIPRIRLSSVEINEIDEEILELLGDSRVCRHLHLPLQSGSDKILKSMNRNYSSATYKKKMSSILRRSSEMAIGTDIIVGFPGEDVRAFHETCDMIRDMPFAYLHIFPYSPREGTAASFLSPTVPGKIIIERAHELKQLGALKRKIFVERHLNKILDVVIEERDGEGRMLGTANNYLKIRVSTESLQLGTLIFVRSEGCEGAMIRGHVIT